MATTWHDEEGNWVVTNRETPICMRCITNTERLGQNTVKANAAQMQVTDAQKISVQCPSCKRVMYREVS